MGTPILEQLAAAELLAVADELLPDRREILRRRKQLAIELLDDRLPDWQPCPGGGGLALWVRLPTPMSSALSAAASRMGLEIPPGPRFGLDGSLERFIRVPYTLPADQLTEAIDLLAQAWRSVTGAATPGRGAIVV
jgi:DNA-binding transcriptional MocR family regulator